MVFPSVRTAAPIMMMMSSNHANNHPRQHRHRCDRDTLLPSISSSSGSGGRPHSRTTRFVALVVAVVVTLQLVMNSVLHSGVGGAPPGAGSGFQNEGAGSSSANSISNSSSPVDVLRRQVSRLRDDLAALEYANPSLYVEDSRFFPFVIRDSRHLVPTQLRAEDRFHVFDYVDVGSPRQAKAKGSQLFYDAALVADAPCQFYSVKCYRQKIIQVFDHALVSHPEVEYYFYMEADNDLCVPMGRVRDLALSEGRYFINTGIGFSGWIMSRQFVSDFLALYRNVTDQDGGGGGITAAAAAGEPEIRPDVLASYYLTDRHAWTVTRQYWVSHTTLESLGASSLTVKDRRRVETGQRLRLDKHLPRCLEPRRGKWQTAKSPLDPRDRFGWDYFDYDVCGNALIFPCEGPDQLARLVAEDWRVANETGALAKQRKKEKEVAAKAAVAAVMVATKKGDGKQRKAGQQPVAGQLRLQNMKREPGWGGNVTYGAATAGRGRRRPLFKSSGAAEPQNDVTTERHR